MTNNKFAALKREKPAPAPAPEPDPKLMKAFVEGADTRSTEIVVAVEPAPEPEAAGKTQPNQRFSRSGKPLVQLNVRLPDELAAAYRDLCRAGDTTIQDDLLRMVKARLKSAARK